MKLLSRVIFINWYLFEQDEWDIKGHVALLGKNGSGKSSFIDALQLVLLGGNKNDWTPNAKAAAKAANRSVRSYSLGLIKEEEAIGDNAEFQPREDALTRIVLVYKDEKTNECTSIGACVSARRGDPQEEWEGFFILEGQELSLSELITKDEVAKSYLDLKSMFVDRAKHIKRPNGSDGTHFFHREPQIFVEQMLRSLSDGHATPSADKFRRSFKQSIKLSGLNYSVSDFVKNSILHEKSINLSNMRKSLETLNNKRMAVKEAKSKIEKLEVIDKDFTKAIKELERFAVYSWCQEEYRVQGYEVQLDNTIEEMLQTYTKYSQKKSEFRDVSSEQKSKREKLILLVTAYQNEDSITQTKILEANLAAITQEITLNNNGINTIKDKLLFADEVLISKEYLEKTWVDEASKLSHLINSSGVFWLDKAADVIKLAKNVANGLPNVIKTINREKDNEALILSNKTNETISIDGQLTTLKQGNSNLKSHTVFLIDELKKENIQATPVCELLEVSDIEWQPAIEAFLSTNTEALVVSLDDTDRAIEIYRALKRNKKFGGVVIDARKVLKWNLDIKVGTAAHLIKGSSLTALNFIQNMLLNINLHNDTKSIRQAKRALAKDGSFQGSGGFKRLYLSEFRVLGKNAVSSQIEFLEGQLSALAPQILALTTKKIKIEKASSVVSEYSFTLNGFSKLKTFIELDDSLASKKQSIDSQINAIDTSHLEEQEKMIENLESEMIKLGNLRDQCIASKSELKKHYRTLNKTRHGVEQQSNKACLQRDDSQQSTSFKAELADTLMQSLEDEYPLNDLSTYDKIINQCIIKTNKSDQLRINNEMNGKQLFAEYKVAYPSGIMSNNQATLSACWSEVDGLLREIKDIGLHDREKDVTDAFLQVQRVIRMDLSIKLRGQIEKMKRRFAELNQELKLRPFSNNQIYQFKYERISKYNEFLTFIETVDEDNAANYGGLFEDSSDINNTINQILDEDDPEGLGDYRNYYTFDIKIKDKESGITELFSKKQFSASGGEHMTPFYVAMGASLAGAYRITRNEDNTVDGGMALYLADEAFDKMDYVNSRQAAEYLKSIGLQIFVAAPDNAEADFRSFVDTVLFFIRDGSNAVIDVDYVTEWAKNKMLETFSAE